MSQFIGKGENKVVDMLAVIFGAVNVFAQYPLKGLIPSSVFEWLDPVYQKHKFDFYVIRPGKRNFVVEVNYKHGDITDSKYNKIFEPTLKKENIDFVNVHDNECKTIFKPKESWNDWIDLMNALILSKIKN